MNHCSVWVGKLVERATALQKNILPTFEVMASGDCLRELIQGDPDSLGVSEFSRVNGVQDSGLQDGIKEMDKALDLLEKIMNAKVWGRASIDVVRWRL